MLGEVSRNEERMQVLERQADQTSKAYLLLLDASEGTVADIATLTEKLTISEKKNKEAETLVKQAKQQSDEYMRLADRFNALERKLEGNENEKRKDR